MIFSIEPGIYIEGSHGVRLENELLVCEGEKNEYGEFLYFEPITYVPFDLDAINPDIMNAEDKERLNTYHATVYEKVSPYLNDEEKEWLKKYTRANKYGNRNTYVDCERDCEDCRECGEDECRYDADFQQESAGIEL
jgi:hypothetical protein